MTAAILIVICRVAVLTRQAHLKMAQWIGFMRECSLAFSSLLANKSQGEMFAYDPLRSDGEGDGEGENLKKTKNTVKIITRVSIQLTTDKSYSIFLGNYAQQIK